MQTAIATVCLSGVLHEKLDAIATAGFKGVEIFENDLLSFNGTPRDVRRLIEGLGSKTIAFQPFRDFEGMPGDRRSRAFQRAERKFDLMQELDCDLLMICSNVSPKVWEASTARQRTCVSLPNGPRSAGCAWALRHWPGASHQRLP